MSNFLWTSEYVSAGHPDKIADQISDALLDAYLDGDKNSRVAIETLVKDNNVVVAGEVTSNSEIHIDKIIRDTITDIGYANEDMRFYGKGVHIFEMLSKQSNEIHNAVDNGNSTGAGDQGIMFGYATNDTPNFMPLAIYLASEFIHTANDCRLKDRNSKLYPDMKSQVTVEYTENFIPVRVDSVVFSVCHSKEWSLDYVRKYVNTIVKHNYFTKLPLNIVKLFDDNTKFLVNTAGAWNIGGPVSDTGLTGRKIVVDQYGADCPIGGGAFSGKDYTKIDRSGAYAARHIAKYYANLYQTTMQVQLSYAIGVPEPVSVRIWSPINNSIKITDFNNKLLTPDNIKTKLHLDSGIYLRTAKYGHFGHAPFTLNGKKYYSWETYNTLLL